MIFKGGKIKEKEKEGMEKENADKKEEVMEKENEDKNQKSDGITIIIHKDKIPHPWDQDGILKYVSPIVNVLVGLVILGSSSFYFFYFYF